MYQHTMHNNSLLDTEYAKYEKKVACTKALEDAKKKLIDAKSVLQLEELKSRKRILRRLGYCTNTDVIQLKGRVACELSRYVLNLERTRNILTRKCNFNLCFSADELIITELIFNGVFKNLSPAQACALLSVFVCDEKSSDAPKLSEELSGPLRQMQASTFYIYIQFSDFL